jgi:hypothetical protein
MKGITSRLLLVPNTIIILIGYLVAPPITPKILLTLELLKKEARVFGFYGEFST